MATIVTLTCPVCGSLFEGFKGSNYARKNCSMDCTQEARRRATAWYQEVKRALLEIGVPEETVYSQVPAAIRLLDAKKGAI